MDLRIPIGVLIGILIFLGFSGPAMNAIGLLMNDGIAVEDTYDKTAQGANFEIEPEAKVMTMEDVIMMILVMDEKANTLSTLDIKVNFQGASPKSYRLRLNSVNYWNNYKEIIIGQLNSDLKALTNPSGPYKNFFENEATLYYTYNPYGVEGLEISIK